MKAQARMKQYADKGRSDRQFQVGDLVYLKLQPYQQVSVSQRKNKKLGPKYYGPFKVTERIGEVAYRIELPPGSTVHPVFHVSQLKKKIGECAAPSPNLPVLGPEVADQRLPVSILERRLTRKGNSSMVMIKVYWKNMPESEATWEEYDEIERKFPDFIAKMNT